MCVCTYLLTYLPSVSMYVCMLALHTYPTLPYLTLPRNPSTLHFISIYLVMYISNTSLLFFFTSFFFFTLKNIFPLSSSY
ncbi:hypothetical protein F4775DRAFT_571124 [Biscogniauxia sp. FL1348]|nr:hypothetical protein F4775DRAFT_571124 [Biscogniauxia sp. FL1348]